MSERQALESTLGAHFAGERLSRASATYAGAAVCPSTVLWVHAWHPLPGLIVWSASLLWASLLVLAGVFVVAARRARAHLLQRPPETELAARLHFAEGTALEMSSLWLFLSILTSTLLWLHALRAEVLPEHTVALAEKVWAIFMTATLVNRALERW